MFSKTFLFMSHMTRKHITLWLRCINCETCSKASMTMKLHKEVDHKNYESSTNFTSFFNRRNRPIGEKMFPIIRSTSSTRFLHPTGDGVLAKVCVLGRVRLVPRLVSRFVTSLVTRLVTGFMA